MAFKGHIVYSRTLSEVEKAANELLTSVETMTKDGGRAAIGFDIEWKPSFRKEVDKYAGHVSPKYFMVGVGIAGDARKVLKPNKIRLGNWETNPLSPEQLSYAATDAFVSWYLFEALNHLPDPDTSTNEAVEVESNAPS
nr:hypothetical protein [Tanacetum cinerariifolium]